MDFTIPGNFDAVCKETFLLQSVQNKVYKNYIHVTNRNWSEQNLPFLPIRFFKTHQVITGDMVPEKKFESSGTTGDNTSIHYIKDVSLYIKSFMACFTSFYGSVKDYCILALLPSYLERPNSSLVFMLEHLIRESQHPDSGFYLHNLNELSDKLQQLESKKQKTILWGVSFALLDLAEKFPMPLYHTIIIETGGMKGRKEEITRDELHQYLCNRFKVSVIHSEYGMTELLSQAYSKGEGLFFPPPWMKIIIRDLYDPFSTVPVGRTGGINIIDLANQHSCSFIETEDIGRLHPDGSFEVLGRIDFSDIRGCNLLV